MKCLHILFLLFSFNYLSAQSDSTNQQIDTTKIIPAKFSGGNAAWNKFLESNVNSNLIVTCGCVEILYSETVAKVTATVRFLIDTSGNVTKVFVVNEKEIDKVFGLKPNHKGANLLTSVQKL